jgi:hypothetical protein
MAKRHSSSSAPKGSSTTTPSHGHATRSSTRSSTRPSKRVRFTGDDNPSPSRPKSKKDKRSSKPTSTPPPPPPTLTSDDEATDLTEDEEEDEEDAADAALLTAMSAPASSTTPSTFLTNPFEDLANISPEGKLMMAHFGGFMANMANQLMETKVAAASSSAETLTGLRALLKEILGPVKVPELKAQLQRPAPAKTHIGRFNVIMQTESDLRRRLNDGTSTWMKDGSKNPELILVDLSILTSIYNLIDRLNGAKKPWAHIALYLADRFQDYVNTGDPSAFDFCILDFEGMTPSIMPDPKDQSSSPVHGGGGKAQGPSSTSKTSGTSDTKGRKKRSPPFSGGLPAPRFVNNREGKPLACTTCGIIGWTTARCPICHGIPIADWKTWDTRDSTIRERLRPLDPESPDYPSCPAATNTYHFNQ